MLYFTLIIIALLVVLRVIIKAPAKAPAKVAKVAKAPALTRKENASNRGREFQGW